MESIIVRKEIEGLKTKEYEYSVNSRGQGLWLNGKQIAGTCDFSASTPAELMRKLKQDTDPMYEKFTMVRGSAQGWE